MMQLPDAAAGETRRRAFLALLLLVPAPSIGVTVALWLVPSLVVPAAVGQIIWVGSKFWLLGLPLFWLLWVDRDKPSLSPVRKGGLGLGAVLGLVISAIIFAGYWILGRQWIDAEHVQALAAENNLDQWPVYLGFVVYTVAVNSLLEEYVWRWFCFRKCEVLLGGLPAVATSALCFTLHHIIALRAYFDWRVVALSSLGVFIGGAAWSWCYLRYRSVWPGYISHAIVDVAVLGVGALIIFG